MGFFNEEKKLRRTSWMVVQEANPRIEMRLNRPSIRRPLDCPRSGVSYAPIYRPMKYEYEGACGNYDYMSIDCVYCAAALMSQAFMGIPYDVRARCDEVMGW
jgi:hypothetical protein